MIEKLDLPKKWSAAYNVTKKLNEVIDVINAATKKTPKKKDVKKS